jgi:uncharacterized protein (TIGR02145 family)
MFRFSQIRNPLKRSIISLLFLFAVGLLHAQAPATASAIASGFTALPAGKFNAAANRFEGLGTETGWWTVVPCETIGNADALCASSFQLVYYCDTPQLTTYNLNDALSVRCVKNHEQQ